jgi:hypothetical protein
MAKKDVKNIDAIAGKMFDEVLNPEQQRTPYDKLNAIFQKIKASHQLSDPAEYFGYNMRVMKRDVQYLIDRFGENSKFFNEIMREHGEVEYNSSSTIYECKVHIPEISGILPEPNLYKILKGYQRPDFINEDAARDRDKTYFADAADAVPEILKMIMFPSFFFFKPGSRPVEYHVCSVKFTDSLPTRGFGIYKATFNEKWLSFQDE